MKDWLDDNWVLILMIGIILFVAVGLPLGAIAWDRAECAIQTAQIGFAHRWSIIGGCLVEVNEGQWIPLGRYYFKQE